MSLLVDLFPWFSVFFQCWEKEIFKCRHINQWILRNSHSNTIITAINMQNISKASKSFFMFSVGNFLLEKEMATHSSNLAWKIPWMEEPGRYSPWICQKSNTTEQLHFHFFTFTLGANLGEGNGNLLQYSCLKNPMDRGAWQATVMGLQSQTGLSN